MKNEPLIDEMKSNIQRKYRILKKSSDAIKRDYKKVMSETFTEYEWRREGKSITENIEKINKYSEELENLVKTEKGKNDDNSDIIKKSEKLIVEIKGEFIPFISNIQKKQKFFLMILLMKMKMKKKILE